MWCWLCVTEAWTVGLLHVECLALSVMHWPIGSLVPAEIPALQT